VTASLKDHPKFAVAFSEAEIDALEAILSGPEAVAEIAADAEDRLRASSPESLQLRWHVIVRQTYRYCVVEWDLAHRKRGPVYDAAYALLQAEADLRDAQEGLLRYRPVPDVNPQTTAEQWAKLGGLVARRNAAGNALRREIARHKETT